MSAKERLKRFRDLQAMATRLQVALIEECDLTRKQVDEIEASIEEGQERCRAFGSWDGKQPDALVRPGKSWIAPTERHIGKMVRVGNSLDGRCPDTWDQAELANVVHTAHGLLYFTKGTKGESVCWNVAWIEADGQDPTDRDGKGYISIQVDKDKPEQADPLIDREGHCTVAEEKWRPQIGDWVRIKKCDPTCCWVGIGMDYLDGQIRQVEQLTTDGSGIIVDNFWLCGICTEPWEPREGEKVQVINVNRVYEVEGFDKTTKNVFCVGRYLGIELRLLKPYTEEPAEAPQSDPWRPKVGDWVRVRKPANPSEQPGWGDDELDGNVCCIREVEQDQDGCDVKVQGSRYWLSSKWLTPCDRPDPGEGYRLLSKFPPEGVVEGDEYFNSFLSTWDLCNFVVSGVQNDSLFYRRKIEQPKQEHQYREPTMADVVFGPSEVECTTADPENAEQWHSRMLLAILPETFDRRFICQHPGVPDSIMRYKHARIKVS